MIVSRSDNELFIFKKFSYFAKLRIRTKIFLNKFSTDQNWSRDPQTNFDVSVLATKTRLSFTKLQLLCSHKALSLLSLLTRWVEQARVLVKKYSLLLRSIYYMHRDSLTYRAWCRESRLCFLVTNLMLSKRVSRSPIRTTHKKVFVAFLSAIFFFYTRSGSRNLTMMCVSNKADFRGVLESFSYATEKLTFSESFISSK